MKYIIYLLSAAALLLSCTKSEISTESDLLIFEGTRSTRVINFTSTDDWIAKASDSWIQIFPTSGSAGEESIRITVITNDPQNDSRKGTVIITARNISHKIVIEQSINEYISVDSYNYYIEPSGGTLDIPIKHNTALSVNIDENSKNWIKHINTKSITEDKYLFDISKNASCNHRQATIAFKSEKHYCEVTINQKGEYIDFSTNTLYVNPEKHIAQITINASCEWEAFCDCNWIKLLNNTGNIGEKTISIDIDENNTYNSRNGEIHFSNDRIGIDNILIVSQDSYKWYIDENGNSYGKGITIDGITWAPVNCGYHPTNAPVGKYYQWGRKYGQAEEYIKVEDIWKGDNGTEDPNTIYIYKQDDENSGSRFEYDWIIKGSNSFWNEGSENSPKKNEDFDPCPPGWRVPTYSEYSILKKNSYYKSGEHGMWFSGSQKYSPDLKEKVFLPAAGKRKGYGDCGFEISKGYYGYYWSSKADGYLHFKSSTYIVSSAVPYRKHALPIRCVHE